MSPQVTVQLLSAQAEISFPSVMVLGLTTRIGGCPQAELQLQTLEWGVCVIPLAAVSCLVLVSFSFNLALWNVWSFFTPLLLFTQFMGVVMLISLLG